MKSTTNTWTVKNKSSRLFDLAFFALVVVTCFTAYAVPLMAYPSAQSNPWPFAYNVIQQQIIEKGRISVETPQFGEWQRADHTWFLLHHMPYVNLKLLTDLPFETLERLLSFVLSIAFFMGYYVFAKKAFGDTLGFVGSIFMLFVPRTHNYLVTVNGEFIGWLILFPALGLFFEFAKKRDRRYLILSSLLAAFLPISNLMVFVEYVLIVWAFLMSEFVTKRKFKRFLKSALIIVLPVLLISLPVLYASGDLHAGTSSTIGSLFSSKSPREAEYEEIYYDQYADYWKLYVNRLPVWTELTYIGFDFIFWFGIGFIFIFYVPLALIGIYFSLKNYKEPRLLFPLAWIILQVALGTVILSPAFGPTVNAAGIRLLLYFGWALPLLSGFGLYHVAKTLKLFNDNLKDVGLHALKRTWRNWKLLFLVIFVGSFIFIGFWVAKRTAGFANTYTMYYSKEYSDALTWLRENTPQDAVIIANDWTAGEIWLKAQRLALIEGGKGSAAYITYEEIITKLQDTRTIFRSENLSEIIMLMDKYKAEWLLIWNRPTAYASNIGLLEQINLTKIDSSNRFVNVFEEKGVYNPPQSLDAYGSPYFTHAIIYYLKQNSTSSFTPPTVQDASGQYEEDTLELSSVLRFSYSFILALFLPGYAWTFLFFANRKIYALERILLSLALSFAFTSVAYFWLNLAGLRVSQISTLIVIVLLTIIPLVLLAIEKHLHVKEMLLTKVFKSSLTNCAQVRLERTNASTKSGTVRKATSVSSETYGIVNIKILDC